MSRDRDLGERFRSLRSEDGAGAEPASRMLGRVRARGEERAAHHWSARPWQTGAAAAAIVALVAALWWTFPQVAPAPAADTELLLAANIDLQRLGSLRTSTDSLLEIARPNLLGSRPPELLPLPKLPPPAPVRESAATRRTLT